MHLRKHQLDDLPFVEYLVNKLKSNIPMYQCYSHSSGNHMILNEFYSDKDDNNSIYLAIASDENEYMGTISLTHIEEGTAEIAVFVREEARHRGYAWYGMEEIIHKAFNDLNLESVYWCVSRRNGRAIRFYDKHNFHEIIDVPSKIYERYRDIEDLKWYSVLRGDEIDIRNSVAGCKTVHIKTIPTVDAGELSYFEGNHDMDFDIKRIYYISKVPEGVRRGFHAHKKLKQLLFCPYGRIQLILENSNGREEIELSDPSIGVVIEECTWREMLWLQKDSVLCVAASDYYDLDDYIRNYNDFLCYIAKSKRKDVKE